MSIEPDITAAIDSGRLGPRLWLYSNYHCNLTCGYCLTESSPTSERRELDASAMRQLVDEAAELGFRGIGITGGEPFLRDDLAGLAGEFSKTLPVLVLTNATRFSGPNISRLDPIVDRDVTLQISLDWADPDPNDAMRAPHNFARVTDAIPRLLERGIGVRVATTVYGQSDAEIDRVSELVASLGVAEEDHVIRPTIHRGRAIEAEMGELATISDLPAEATVTVDGLFWSPFAPTITAGRLDTDLLVSRQTLPLESGMSAFLGLVSGTPVPESNRFR